MRKYLISARLVSTLTLVLVVLLAATSQATTKALPIPAQALIGVWIGFDQYQFEFTRLDLRADSTGYCAQVFTPDSAQVYRIQKWGVDGFNLTADLMPLSTNARKGLRLRGRAGLAWMKLQITGKGWKRELLLFPEARLADSNQEAKRRIESVTK